jgi:hypothetical protein
VGDAVDDASDRLLHSETTVTRIPVTSSLPGAAPLLADLAACSRGCPRPEACASCSLARRRFRVPPARPKTCERASRASGALDASETGEDRVSRRDPHFSDRLARCARRFLPRVDRVRPPLASLSPPPCKSLFESRVRSMRDARRPPRSVPRGPREGRALLRPEMPSIARTSAAAPAPKRERPRTLLLVVALT